MSYSIIQTKWSDYLSTSNGIYMKRKSKQAGQLLVLRQSLWSVSAMFNIRAGQTYRETCIQKSICDRYMKQTKQ